MEPSISPNYRRHTQSIESIITRRAELIKRYNVEGFEVFNQQFQKGKPWRNKKASDVGKFMGEKFDDLLEAMLFVMFLIKEKYIDLDKEFSEQPNTIFHRIFSKFVRFKDSKELEMYIIITFFGELFIMDFRLVNENVEFSFLVPFLVFRGIEPEATNFHFHMESQIDSSSLYLKGVDYLNRSRQMNTLNIFSLRTGKFLFICKPAKKKSHTYKCPLTVFSKDDLGELTSKDIILLVKEPGLTKVTLVQENDDMTYTPIITFIKTFVFSDLRLIAMPEFRSKEDCNLLLPKNGVLPENKYVLFISDFKNYSRVFLRIDYGNYACKIQLIKRVDGKSTRNIYIPPNKGLMLVGERKVTLQLEEIAEFKSRPYGKIFDEISKSWLQFSDQSNDIEIREIKRQLTTFSHHQDILIQIEDEFNRFEKVQFMHELKKVKSFSELLKGIQKYSNESLARIILAYSWIVENMRFNDKKQIIQATSILKSKSEQSKLDYLVAGRVAAEKEFSYLFRSLMQAMFIECFTIDGFLRCTNRDQTSAVYSWNIVKQGDYYYYVDSCRATYFGNSLSEIEKERLLRYYFFTLPSQLHKTHFPEDDDLSIYPGYKFSFIEYLTAPILHPALNASSIKLLINCNYSMPAPGGYLHLRLSSLRPLILSISSLGSNHILVYKTDLTPNSFPLEYVLEIYIFLNIIHSLRVDDPALSKVITLCCENHTSKSNTHPSLFASILSLSRCLLFQSPTEMKSESPLPLMTLKAHGYRSWTLKNPLPPKRPIKFNSNIVLLRPGIYWLPRGEYINFSVWGDDYQIRNLKVWGKGARAKKSEPTANHQITSVRLLIGEGEIFLGEKEGEPEWEFMGIDPKEIAPVFRKLI